MLPTFECSMNIWDPQYNRCSIPANHEPNYTISLAGRTPQYAREQSDFMCRLKLYIKQRNMGTFKQPMLGKREVDLYRLFREVTAHGGCDNVIKKEGTWSRIYRGMDNYSPTETSASYRLKKMFLLFDGCQSQIQQIPHRLREGFLQLQIALRLHLRRFPRSARRRAQTRLSSPQIAPSLHAFRSEIPLFASFSSSFPRSATRLRLRETLPSIPGQRPRTPSPRPLSIPGQCPLYGPHFGLRSRPARAEILRRSRFPRSQRRFRPRHRRCRPQTRLYQSPGSRHPRGDHRSRGSRGSDGSRNAERAECAERGKCRVGRAIRSQWGCDAVDADPGGEFAGAAVVETGNVAEPCGEWGSCREWRVKMRKRREV